MNATLPMALTAEEPSGSRKVWVGVPWEEKDWDRQGATLPGFELFHTAAWARVLHEAYGYKPFYLRVIHGDQTALLPCLEIDSWLTGRRGVALPFTDRCLPLGDSRLWEALEQEVARLAESRKWSSFELRGGNFWAGTPRPSLSFFRHVLALEGGLEKLFGGFESAVRRAIRKALSEKVETTVCADLEGMRTYYRLHALTRRKHGLPPQPWSFFEAVQRHVVANGLGFVIIARRDSEAIAGDVFFHFGNRAVYKYGASDERRQQLRGSSLAMWAGIQHCVELGCRSLDFGRTSLGNKGLRRFKLGWGTAEEQLDYWKYSYRLRGFVTERDQAEGLHNRLFRLMPLRMARWVGAVMYRHVG